MTLLPLFLQASLVLFCLGLLKFARNLNQPPVVTLTLTVVVGSIFLSVLSTAITPGFQFLESHRRFGLLTSQCPCKSPQSWAFYKLLGWPSFMPTDSSCLNHRTCQTTGARIYKYIYEIGLTGQMSSGRYVKHNFGSTYSALSTLLLGLIMPEQPCLLKSSIGQRTIFYWRKCREMTCYTLENQNVDGDFLLGIRALWKRQTTTSFHTL
jgi:hypothetical protein